MLVARAVHAAVGSPLKSSTLETLTLRLARGDRSAFRPLYTALWPVLLAFCTRALRDQHDAQDAAQEALLKIYARVGQYDPSRGRVLTWALHIAAFECRTVRKRHARRREDFGVDTQRVSAEATPEELTIQQDLVDAVREILGELPSKQADAIVARAFDDAPSGATFRKRLQRGLDALRRAWRARHVAG